MKKIVMAALTVVALSVGTNSSVGAEAPVNENMITICHRDNSVKKPYVSITVDQSAADGIAGNSGGQADHFGEHKGPVASSEAVAQGYKDAKTEWGDIIPPITGVHGGLNWTAEGQAIYNNGCNYVTPSNQPVGGMGGGNIAVPAAPANPAAPASPKTPQVQVVPSQGVNAGGGGASMSVIPSVVGLTASVLTMGYGIRRLNKFNA